MKDFRTSYDLTVNIAEPIDPASSQGVANPSLPIPWNHDEGKGSAGFRRPTGPRRIHALPS
jgi:hypothetical protein